MTDAIDTLNKTQRVFARQFTGKRYDVGDKFGFLKTSIEYGLKHPEVKDSLKEYLIELSKELTPTEKTATQPKPTKENKVKRTLAEQLTINQSCSAFLVLYESG